MSLEIEVRETDGWHVIAVSGEVDLNSSPQLRKAVLGAIERKPRVAVDLGGAQYMDSSGVATLVEALKSASDKRKTFVLVNASTSVTRVLELARLNSLFDMRTTLDKA